MASGLQARTYGAVFDEVAERYDRHRPSYPDALVDRACEIAGLQAGAAVLEVGCGTGQLTLSLLERGLRVTAVEPGERLIERARIRLADRKDVEFVNTRLENAPLPSGHFQAVFCASAIHWTDPDVCWRRMADALIDGGTLALLSYFGLEQPGSASDQRALREAMARVSPQLAADWPVYRDLDAIRAGAAARRHNVSEAWAWLGDYEMARAHAAELFGQASLATEPVPVTHTGAQLGAVLGTMSFWARLSAGQRESLLEEVDDLHRRLGRPIRSSTVACLLTARRKARRRAAGSRGTRTGRRRAG